MTDKLKYDDQRKQMKVNLPISFRAALSPEPYTRGSNYDF